MLRGRQLAFQIQAVRHEGASAWRPAICGEEANGLLAARGRPQLRVQLPLTASGVSYADSAVFVRTISLRGRPPLPGKVQPAPAGAPAAPAHAAAPTQRLATPPQLLEQPAKRSRMTPPVHPLHHGHLIAPSIIIPMPALTSSLSSCSSSPTPGSHGSSPLAWLIRLSAGVSRLLTPISVSAS